MDTGIEQVEDPGVIAQAQRQARRVLQKSVLLGAVLTLLLLLVPR